MFTDIAGLLASVGVIIIGIIAAWVTGNIKGKASEKVKAAEQRTQDKDEAAAEVIKQNQSAIAEQNKAVVEANEIDEVVARMSDDDVLSELYNGNRTAANGKNGDKK